ncbi:MAG: PepSY domain-containing protein [Paracoccaceae bacterium]
MFKHSKTLLLATLLAPGVALAQINIGDELGATETAIRAALEAQGYTTTEIEVEDGEIEIAASSAGRFFEIEVSPETGLVRAVEEGEKDDDGDEDEDDSDDDH